MLLLRARHIAVALSVAGVMFFSCSRRVGKPSTEGVRTSAKPSDTLSATSQPLGVRMPESRPSQLIVAKQVGRSAVLEFPKRGTEWPEHCQSRRQCPSVEPIKHCIRPINAVDAFRLDQVRGGDRIAVRGPLWIGGPMFSTKAKCRNNNCCNQFGATVSVGALSLRDSGCVGDDSGVCCNVPAFGQNVIATGVVKLIESVWTLTSPDLCVE